MPKITLMNRWTHKDKSDCVWIKLGCACGGGDDCDIEVSIDMEFPSLDIIFFKEMRIWNPYEHPDEWYEHIFKWLRRIKNSIKVLFGNRIDHQSDFMFDSDEHIQNVINVLTDGHALVKASLDKIKEDQYKENLRKMDETKDRL